MSATKVYEAKPTGQLNRTKRKRIGATTQAKFNAVWAAICSDLKTELA